jgi:2-desacetyl-2-hydroxyethyl bacteriochlorophyllide A dehydrogenase
VRNVGIEYPEPRMMGFYDLGPVPELEPTQILLRTRYSGVTNGTERHAMLAEHGWKRFPGRHGYQHIGQIESVGESVSGFRPDDWIFYGQYVGHRAWHAIEIDPHGAHLCLPLPEDVDRKHCALFGVAGVALRAVRRLGVAAGQKVWVAGLGSIGQFAAQCARAVGADVTVTDVDDRRMAVAAKLGAHRVIRADDASASGALKQAGPFDCIIDCCGVESLLEQIAQMGVLARNGVVGLMAVRSDTTFPWSMLHGREARLEVSCHFGLDDLRVLLHLYRQGVVRIEPLVSHGVSVDQAPVIYEALRDDPRRLLGVIFDWSE